MDARFPKNFILFDHERIPLQDLYKFAAPGKYQTKPINWPIKGFVFIVHISSGTWSKIQTQNFNFQWPCVYLVMKIRYN